MTIEIREERLKTKLKIYKEINNIRTNTKALELLLKEVQALEENLKEANHLIKVQRFKIKMRSF